MKTTNRDLKKNAIEGVITKAEIVYPRTGLFTVRLHILCKDWNNTVFGDHALYLSKGWETHNMMSPAGHFMARTMQVVGVENWNELEGKKVLVVKSGVKWNGYDERIIAVGDLKGKDFFVPSVEFKKLYADADEELTIKN